MMQSATRTWEELRNGARVIERTLGDKITAYTSMSRNQMCSVVEVYDEENPREETANEKELAACIEDTLASLSDIIDEMNAHVEKTSMKTQESILQRYRELYFDFNTEFRRSMSALQERKDAKKLFGNRAHNVHSEDAEMDSLLNERRAVDSSRSITSSIIEQAMTTRNALENQRRQFMSSHGKVATLGSSFTGINTLVEQVRRKKMRNNTILALVIAGCVCFTLWWVILSKL